MKNTQDQTYHIFVGYDEREHEVFQVCKHTLEKYSSVPIKVHKLHHKPLRDMGLLTREWKIDSRGQYIDLVDGRPFSTQFTFSRFLLPEIWKSINDPNKSPLVMFVDCDFVYLKDIGLMFQKIEDQKNRFGTRHAVYCVQHDYKPDNTVKMDGIEQSKYNKKLWAAMMVFDMDHAKNHLLDSETVNTATGRDLMQMFWVDDNTEIGRIAEEWHFIPSHSERNTNDIAAIHYTEGGPWFPNYRTCKYGNLWFKAYNEYLASKLINVHFKTEDIIDGN